MLRIRTDKKVKFYNSVKDKNFDYVLTLQDLTHPDNAYPRADDMSFDRAYLDPTPTDKL